MKANREWVGNQLPYSLGGEKGSSPLLLLFVYCTSLIQPQLAPHQSFWSILHVQEGRGQAVFSHEEIAADVKIFLVLHGTSGYRLWDTCSHFSQLWPTTFFSPGCLGLLTPKGCIKRLLWCVYLEKSGRYFHWFVWLVFFKNCLHLKPNHSNCITGTYCLHGKLSWFFTGPL